MNKVGYTDQNRLDPQWVPSDAEMIDWVERGGYVVTPNTPNADGVRLWQVCCRLFGGTYGHNIADGASWRTAVEAAMRRDATIGS